MSSYETVPGTTNETITISGIEWKAETLQIFAKCYHTHKSCQCTSYTVTGEPTDDSEYTGWKVHGSEAPGYDIGPQGYYVMETSVTGHAKDLEPYIEEHCEVCDV